MKTHDIKRGLKWLAFDCDTQWCDDCKFADDCHTYDSMEIAKNALTLIGRLEAQAPCWISVKDRLPTKEDTSADERVLCVISDAAGSLANERRAYHWEMVVNHPSWFTYWMPMPEPPKEG